MSYSPCASSPVSPSESQKQHYFGFASTQVSPSFQTSHAMKFEVPYSTMARTPVQSCFPETTYMGSGRTSPLGYYDGHPQQIIINGSLTICCEHRTSESVEEFSESPTAWSNSSSAPAQCSTFEQARRPSCYNRCVYWKKGLKASLKPF